MSSVVESREAGLPEFLDCRTTFMTRDHANEDDCDLKVLSGYEPELPANIQNPSLHPTLLLPCNTMSNPHFLSGSWGFINEGFEVEIESQKRNLLRL